MVNKTILINEIIRIMKRHDLHEKEIARDLLILDKVLDNQVEFMEFLNGVNIEDLHIEFIFDDTYYFITTFDVSTHSSDVVYRIELSEVSDYCGYCRCTPSDEGYNEEHRCCGVACDWGYPRCRITRIERICEVEFEGIQRDLWEAEDKFIEKYFGKSSLVELKKQEKKEQMKKDIEWHKAMIKQLEKELEN